MSNAFYRLDIGQEFQGTGNRVGFERDVAIVVYHLDMASKANGLFGDLLFKANHNADSNNHHRKAEGYGNCGDADKGAGEADFTRRSIG